MNQIAVIPYILIIKVPVFMQEAVNLHKSAASEFSTLHLKILLHIRLSCEGNADRLFFVS